MSNLKLWQRLRADRASVLALIEVEKSEAQENGDVERLTIADRYHHQAKRLFATADRKVAELSQAVPA